MISKSSRASSLPRTCNPVVPASPSIKTFFFSANSEVADDRADFWKANPEVRAAPKRRREAIDNFMVERDNTR